MRSPFIGNHFLTITCTVLVLILMVAFLKSQRSRFYYNSQVVNLRESAAEHFMPGRTPKYSHAAWETLLMEGQTDGQTEFGKMKEFSHSNEDWRNASKHHFVYTFSYKENGLVDILNSKPITFIPHYTTPCWFDTEMDDVADMNRNKYMTKLRCLPSVFLIGAAHSGTKDILDRMTNHPELRQTCVPETNWWPLYRFGDPRVDIELYIDCVTNKVEFEEHPHVIQIVDYSSHLFSYSGNWFHDDIDDIIYNDAQLSSAREIIHILPDARFILLLRDPIERLLSHYQKITGGSGSTADFDQRAKHSIHQYESCIQVYPEHACAYNQTSGDLDVGLHLPITDGLYSLFLTEWFTEVPKEQILILRSEEEDFDKLRKIFSFIGVASPGANFYRKVLKLPRQRVSESAVGLWSSTQKLLHRFYQPYNDRLAHMLEDENVFGNNVLYV